MKNNLFNYATSELSQDAFICWLCSFAYENTDTDPILKECAQDLISLFVPECSSKDVIITNIERQVEHTDVLLTVKCKNEKYKIIVEDKMYTNEHDNQLKKYLDTIKEIYSDYHVRGVYYKTGFQSDLSVVKEAGYNFISRKQMLDFMHPYTEKIKNQIFLDYYEYWNDFQKKVEEYKSLPVSDWGWHQINGFYDFLKANNDTSYQNLWTGYGYVANQSGGFYGLWTGDYNSKVSLDGRLYELYLQIEAVPSTNTSVQICLKLSVKDNLDKSDIRKDRNDIIFDENWNYKLGKYNFVKPKRLSLGNHMTLGTYALNFEKIKDLTYKIILDKMEEAIKDYLKLLSDIKQDDNEFAQLLLDTIVFPEKRKIYNPVVLVCKNEMVAKQMLNEFKSICTKEKIKIINGVDMILNNNAFSNEQNVFVMFENLQIVAGNSIYEQRFFDLYNLLWTKSVSMIITLNDEPGLIHFQGRNYSRLTWGIKAEIT